MESSDIVIVGAGIIGLDVAYALAEKGYGRNVLIVAEHLPGDTSIRYASPWAGANFSAISGSDKNALYWDRLGYSKLKTLISRYGNKCMVRRTPSTEYWDVKPSTEKISSMSSYLDDFRILERDSLPQGAAFGVKFTTFTINVPGHLLWLSNLLQAEYGVRFLRQKLDRIGDAFGIHRASILFNCTGNASRSIPDVQDTKCLPTRGQILLARAPQVSENIMRHGINYETYIIPRPFSNGNVILGGFMQKGNSNPDTINHESNSIIRRTHDLLPALRNSQTEILAAFAGLRPSREGGARVEKKVSLSKDGSARVIVHNYGAGGTGFQAGHGMATNAVGLVVDELSRLLPMPQARL